MLCKPVVAQALALNEIFRGSSPRQGTDDSVAQLAEQLTLNQ